MASSANVIRQHGSLMMNKKCFEDFDSSAFADELLDRAAKLAVFAEAQMGPVLDDKAPKKEREAVARMANPSYAPKRGTSSTMRPSPRISRGSVRTIRARACRFPMLHFHRSKSVMIRSIFGNPIASSSSPRKFYQTALMLQKSRPLSGIAAAGLPETLLNSAFVTISPTKAKSPRLSLTPVKHSAEHHRPMPQ